MAIRSKSDLIARSRGKGGTLVRVRRSIVRETIIGTVTYPAGVYVVKDLMDRRTWNRPDQIGIGPLDRGFAFGVSLREIDIEPVQ